MMGKEEKLIVTRVRNHLLDNEKRGWDGLDDYIDYLEYLDDDQLHRECDVIYEYHKNANVQCQQNHSKDKCFIPLLIESVGYILELYKNTNSLHHKNKYILHYYLAMQQAGMILVSPD